MKYTAIIPVRGGSRRLPGKNILPFGDSNLLIHKIRQLKKVEALEEIIVSSDSDEMLQMAEQEGVKTHRRAIEYADEQTKSWGEIVEYCAEHVCRGEHVMWAYSVTPLCNEVNYKEAIRKYEELVIGRHEYDSVASVKLFKEYLWGEAGPINYKVGTGHIPSQQLPNWHVIVNGFFIAPRIDMIRWQYQFGPNPYRMVVSKKAAIDIDDAEDLAMARALYTPDSEV